jgi:hypothetical protein
VAHQVVIHLGPVHDQQPAPGRRQRRLHIPGTEPANLSRCSTATVTTDGSRSSARNLPRLPSSADPTSVTTRPTGRPSPTVHAVTRPPAGPGRPAGQPTIPARTRPRRQARHPPASRSTRIRRPARRTVAGSFPSRNHRYAVTGCTPCRRAHSLQVHSCILSNIQSTTVNIPLGGPARHIPAARSVRPMTDPEGTM